uniref:Uncharacterized protein n=1 Tax=Chromera velia CCMP2878 TaxID=1169474 RepID=A0A0G4HXD2_9ALVE|mmetsp:Transcript_25531/g.49928  ORF Transcript_25531/g.49928 Transcript_25531/m.49928 type:complete len:439 (+) Transcript_25531:262-1578(+)|eukprot:Cvel_9267.t1-p1 / transcript=Cvel_9267.t1 / gene=Cvel_9267 / organism=Chromera_velia_CCMP2878 / gene_product=hypothetical protein / transcript_product=hypothetical protein / location=Cvel_scaffold529:69253-73054(-) / protein_length=438 / sequence_SO=supercontig / SO=protein_coding / is_pseudo=false
MASKTLSVDQRINAATQYKINRLEHNTSFSEFRGFIVSVKMHRAISATKEITEALTEAAEALYPEECRQMVASLVGGGLGSSSGTAEEGQQGKEGTTGADESGASCSSSSSSSSDLLRASLFSAVRTAMGQLLVCIRCTQPWLDPVALLAFLLRDKEETGETVEGGGEGKLCGGLRRFRYAQRVAPVESCCEPKRGILRTSARSLLERRGFVLSGSIDGSSAEGSEGDGERAESQTGKKPVGETGGKTDPLFSFAVCYNGHGVDGGKGERKKGQKGKGESGDGRKPVEGDADVIVGRDLTIPFLASLVELSVHPVSLTEPGKVILSQTIKDSSENSWIGLSILDRTLVVPLPKMQVRRLPEDDGKQHGQQDKPKQKSAGKGHDRPDGGDGEGIVRATSAEERASEKVQLGSQPASGSRGDDAMISNVSTRPSKMQRTS